MALLEILTYPNPRLKKISQPVDSVTDDMRQLVDDMLETMYAAPGIGLAAPQVGELIRMLVIDTRSFDDDGNLRTDLMTEMEQKVDYPIVIFNPVINKKEGKTQWEEGCLSVPGFSEMVDRAEYIEATGLDRDGNEFEIKTDGLLAVCLQHEIDHLDGKLYIDRLSFVKSNKIRNKIKKFGYPEPDEDDIEDRNIL